MATTAALPLACPLCGFVFGILDIATQQAHYLAHMVAQLGRTATADTAPQNPSADW